MDDGVAVNVMDSLIVVVGCVGLKGERVNIEKLGSVLPTLKMKKFLKMAEVLCSVCLWLSTVKSTRAAGMLLVRVMVGTFGLGSWLEH